MRSRRDVPIADAEEAEGASMAPIWPGMTIARRAADRRTAWATSAPVNVHESSTARMRNAMIATCRPVPTIQARRNGKPGAGAGDLNSSRTALTFAGDDPEATERREVGDEGQRRRRSPREARTVPGSRAKDRTKSRLDRAANKQGTRMMAER